MISVQQQINSLREELNLHNHNYYVKDDATISDYEFDIKLKELEVEKNFLLEKKLICCLIKTDPILS